MEKKTEQHHQQVVEGIPRKFLVSNVPTWALSTVIPQRTIDLVRGFWVPVTQISIIRTLCQVSKVWISETFPLRAGVTQALTVLIVVASKMFSMMLELCHKKGNVVITLN